MTEANDFAVLRQWAAAMSTAERLSEARHRYATRHLEALLRWHDQPPKPSERTCANCGKRFVTSVRDRDLCSPLCRSPLTRIGYANCVACGTLLITKGTQERKTCGAAECQRKYRNARVRKREHIRRGAVSDITPDQELAMRKRTRKCRLCGVYMTNKIGLPNSKHLDHILPISQGGTHTHGNVRIICQTCNLKRPKDGSDFAGQLTLWAQEPGVVPRLRGNLGEVKGTCRKGLHPWIPENIEHHGAKRRCKPCREAYEHENGRRAQPRQCACGTEFGAANQYALMCPACTDIAVRKAIELHASGIGWDEVAAQVGYGSGWGIAYAAKRAGYVPAPRPAKPAKAAKVIRVCPACGTANITGRCRPCTTAKAWRAVHLRQQQGWTLRQIADELGYDSINSVTNLMRTVVTIEPRIGRPITHSDGAA